MNGNSVTFFGVPVLPPDAAGVRVFRITNVRVNAQPLGGNSQSGALPVQASISVSNASSLPIVNPTPIVGYVSNGLSASAGSAANLSQCSNQTKTSAATLTFAENFGTAFKTRVTAQSNTLFAGQIEQPRPEHSRRYLQLRIRVCVPDQQYSGRWFVRLRNSS